MNSYLLGGYDYADGKLLKFLSLNDPPVLEFLRESNDDAAVGHMLVKESGRSAGEIQAWGTRFRRVNAPCIVMCDADEGLSTSSVEPHC